ncbi:GntR family transcriptional regulator [Candidatus Laterigemmans baculatus]|uniref:GntR family transcriptional regulator n=1 Tax=Candidatus Laterigemmans baculatus TaxID=2770505 RepID=UPI0013DBE676|nr:GntR family transcriptional regulator [Candidatus Laterigemmans baculatus]
MRFSIDTSNGVPIYEQIVRQVTFAVAEGVLVSGQMVPSVRQLSTTLAINPNTIARAYQQLQSDQVLESLRGRGLVVRADAAPRCDAARQAILADRLRSVLSEALHAGLSTEQLREMFEQQIQNL